MRAISEFSASVLVLDDQPLIAMLLQDFLADLGCTVVGPASSVTAALRLIERNPLDAAILDVTLKNETCYPVATALRQRGIPFAFATGHSSGAIDAAFEDVPVLSKPFDFDAVKAMMDKLVKK